MEDQKEQRSSEGLKNLIALMHARQTKKEAS
jgi:hypothetical protein